MNQLAVRALELFHAGPAALPSCLLLYICNLAPRYVCMLGDCCQANRYTLDAFIVGVLWAASSGQGPRKRQHTPGKHLNTLSRLRLCRGLPPVGVP